MKFGIFDHIDANGMAIGEQYAQRLRLVELYEKLGFYCYHLTEHHATDLGHHLRQRQLVPVIAVERVQAGGTAGRLVGLRQDLKIGVGRHAGRGL